VCQEKVSRPRSKENKLTIRDLGGENSGNYRLPSSVRYAIHAFRSKEGVDNTEDGGVLEELGTDIAPDRKGSGRAFMGLFIFACLCALGGFLYFQDPDFTKVREGLDAFNSGGTQANANRGLTYLEEEQIRGEVPIRALEEAYRAWAVAATKENAAILETVRKAYIGKIEQALVDGAHSLQKLSSMAVLSARAAEADDSPRIQALNAKVQKAKHNADPGLTPMPDLEESAFD
jgi:hypothetical protein